MRLERSSRSGRPSRSRTSGGGGGGGSFGALHTAIMDQSPLIYMPLDEASGAPENYGSVTPTITVGASVTQGGTAGSDGGDYALFPGGSYAAASVIDVAHDVALNRATASGITWFAIVKPTAALPSRYNFLAKNNDWLNDCLSDGRLLFNNPKAAGSTGKQWVSTTTAVNGTWHVWSGGSPGGNVYPSTILQNGVNTGGSSGGTTPLTGSTDSLTIGGQKYLASADILTGAVGHVAVFAGDMSVVNQQLLHTAAETDGWY